MASAPLAKWLLASKATATARLTNWPGRLSMCGPFLFATPRVIDYELSSFSNVWHCLESDVVTNRQDPLRFPAVLLIGQTLSVPPLALLDVVVAFCRMEDFCTTSSSATQPPHLKVYANRRMESHYGLRCDFLTCRGNSNLVRRSEWAERDRIMRDRPRRLISAVILDSAAAVLHIKRDSEAGKRTFQRSMSAAEQGSAAKEIIRWG